MPPPINQTRQNITPHPSNRSGEPYSQDMRDMVLSVLRNGTINDAAIQQLRQQHQFPSAPTVSRWIQLERQLGHCRPCRRNGNVTASTLRGPDLILLAMYRIAFPKARHSEINAFLFAQTLVILHGTSTAIPNFPEPKKFST